MYFGVLLSSTLSQPPGEGSRPQPARSQDDATVGYLFQRPQSDFPAPYGKRLGRWALGDESIMESVSLFVGQFGWSCFLSLLGQFSSTISNVDSFHTPLEGLYFLVWVQAAVSKQVYYFVMVKGIYLNSFVFAL